MRSLIRNIRQSFAGWFRPRNQKPVKKDHNPQNAPRVKSATKGNTHPKTSRSTARHVLCRDSNSARGKGRKNIRVGRTGRKKRPRYESPPSPPKSAK